MGFIVQMQRYAIETLAGETPHLNLPIVGLRLYLDDGGLLHILGVSRGVGTCSLIHGINVLVVSEVSGNGYQLDCVPLSVAYVVLLRQPTGEEIQRHAYLDRECLQTIELLELVEGTGDKIILRKTGRAASYVHI